MEFIENVEKEELESFVNNHPTKAHFMQSYYWGIIQKNKNFLPFYVGVKENNKLIASAVILEKKVWKNIKYLYCPRGFVADYENKEVVEFFIENIKKFTKKRHAMFFRMDPDIPLSITKNEEKQNCEIGKETIELLKKHGLKHKGFNLNFENNQPRFTFRLALDKTWEEIYANFHPTTRKILNKGNPFHLPIYKGTEKDLDDFYVTMQQTAKEKNIIPSKLEYYKTFYTELNKQNKSDLYIIKVNIEDLQNNYLEKINTLKDEIKKIEQNPNKNIEKSKQKIEEMNKQIEKLQKEVENVKKITQKEITLSSIITAKYKDMVWTIHGGNHSLLRELNANYILYEQIIKDAYNEGYKKIDFFGTTGNPTPDNPVYGIHLFKKRFGGDLYEFIGEFDYVSQKGWYFIYNKLLPFIRKKQKKLAKKSTK